MKKILTLFIASLTLLSCKQNGKREIILPRSNGNTNSILVVMKGDDWLSKPGDEN